MPGGRPSAPLSFGAERRRLPASGMAAARPRSAESLALGRWPTRLRRRRRVPRAQRRRLPARRGPGAQARRRGPSAAREARDRPDGARHPPRPHGRAAEAARVPGLGHTRRADRRRLHRARGRPERPLALRPRALGRGDRRQRADLPGAGVQGRSTAERLEVRRNGEWLDMPMEELFRLARTTTVAQILERDDFAKRFAAREPISVLELLYPLLQGYDSVAVAPTSSSAAPTRSSTCCSAATSSAPTASPSRSMLTHADPAGHRRRAEDVEVARQPHRRHRGARGDVRQDDAHPRRGDGELVRLLLGERAARRTRPRATPSARWPAALVERFHGAEAAEAAEAHFDRVFVERELPEEIEEVAFARRRRRRSTCPALHRRALRGLALGGAAPARPGRRQARRRAAGGDDAGRPGRARWTGGSCRSASAGSGACVVG